ncbi:MAG: STAS domain-containing protein [Gemmataceae bacterium]
MAGPQGNIQEARREQGLTLRVMGWARMAQGLALRRHVERCLTENVVDVKVDLRHCEYMDSTFLGTLMFLWKTVGQRGTFQLVSPSPSCLKLLCQVALDDVIPQIYEDETNAGAWEEVPCGMEPGESLQRHVVEAHEELAEQPGPAGAVFRDIVQDLKQDLERRQQRKE